MNGTFEIFTNKEWMILPLFVHGILPTVMNNANNHSLLGIDREKKNPMCINAQGDDIFREYEVTEDGTVLPVYDGWYGIDYLKELREPFVNVIPIDGPITRNGGACSYGSKDIRDWMMKASDNPYCQCHVLVINTPGGSAWAKNDFQQAIDYAHSKGMRVIAFIDGLCASAGMYLASLCDEVYVMNLKDQLGCVGVMASFFTMKSGDKNEFSSETYREYYATKSINKNKEMRDIAENDDATLLIEELDKLEAEFRDDMKASFPKATDEHLDGKVFDADEVMGILCDGQMMLGEVIARGFALGNGSAQPIERTADRKIGKHADVTDSHDDEPHDTEKNHSHHNNNTNMANIKEQFPALFAALQVEEMQMTEEGTFMNTELMARLNDALAEKKAEEPEAPAGEPAAEPVQEPAQEPAAGEDAQEPAAEPAAEPAQEPAAEPSGDGAQEPAAEPAAEPAQEPAQEPTGEGDQEPAAEPAAEPAQEPASQEAIEAAQEDIDKIQETLHNAEQMIADKDAVIAELKASLDGQKSTAEQLQADIDQARKDIEAANGTIAEKDATIEKLTKQVSDLKAEVKELAGTPAPMTDEKSGIPADNGTGDAPKVRQKRITRENMTYENCRKVAKGE